MEINSKILLKNTDRTGPTRTGTENTDHVPDQLVSDRLSSNQNFEPIKFGPGQNFGPINSEPPTGPTKNRTKINDHQTNSNRRHTVIWSRTIIHTRNPTNHWTSMHIGTILKWSLAGMVKKWMGSLLMLNKFSTLLKLFSEIVFRSRSFQVAWQQGWITIETIPRNSYSSSYFFRTRECFIVYGSYRMSHTCRLHFAVV